MFNLLNFQDWGSINESGEILADDLNWREGGIVFIRSLPFPDGSPRLYAGRAQKIWKKPNGPYMAKITPEGFYIILKEGFGYEAKKIGTSPRALQILGLTSHTIGLNSKTGKTPGWYDTVSEVDFQKLLREWSPVLDGWKDVSYYPLSRSSSDQR